MATPESNPLDAASPLEPPQPLAVAADSAVVRIDGKDYAEIGCDTLPFTNACNFCAFKGTACYSRRDFDCHSDSRPDGRDVVFQLLPNNKGLPRSDSDVGSSA